MARGAAVGVCSSGFRAAVGTFSSPAAASVLMLPSPAALQPQCRLAPLRRIAPFLKTTTCQLRKRRLRLRKGANLRREGERAAPEQRFRTHLLPKGPLRRQNDAGSPLSFAPAAKIAPPAPKRRPSVRYRSNHVQNKPSGVKLAPESPSRASLTPFETKWQPLAQDACPPCILHS